jgi:hypothetical protein
MESARIDGGRGQVLRIQKLVEIKVWIKGHGWRRAQAQVAEEVGA